MPLGIKKTNSDKETCLLFHWNSTEIEDNSHQWLSISQDVGHSILEAYSRVLRNLAFSIMSRIGEILQEDTLSNPNSPVATLCFPGMNMKGNLQTPACGPRARQSLIDQMNRADGKYCDSDSSSYSEREVSYNEARRSCVNATPSRSRVWCIGKEACIGVSPRNSPWYGSVILNRAFVNNLPSFKLNRNTIKFWSPFLTLRKCVLLGKRMATIYIQVCISQPCSWIQQIIIIKITKQVWVSAVLVQLHAC